MFVKFNAPNLSSCQNVNESFADSKRIEPTLKTIEVETPDQSSQRSDLVCESIDSIRNNTLREELRSHQTFDIDPAAADDLENSQSPCGTVGQYQQKPNLVIRRTSIPNHCRKILNPLVLKDEPETGRSYLQRWVT